MSDTFTRLVYHVVFGTKDRAPLIYPEFRDRLYRYIHGIVRGEGGVLLEIGGVADHVHLVLGLRPSRPLSDWMRVIKARSSKWVNEERRGERFAWQAGYGAFSVSSSRIDATRRYVRRQEEHHRRLTFDEEIAAFCRAAGIEAPDEV